MRKADNLPPSCAVVMKSGNLNFLEPSGPLQACNGTALPLHHLQTGSLELTFPQHALSHSFLLSSYRHLLLSRSLFLLLFSVCAMFCCSARKGFSSDTVYVGGVGRNAEDFKFYHPFSFFRRHNMATTEDSSLLEYYNMSTN